MYQAVHATTTIDSITAYTPFIRPITSPLQLPPKKGMPTSPSERRPSDFLGSNLETTDMDPDLMFASASMGGYFQLPDWNASSMAVHEYEIATPYEDDPQAERLILRRSVAWDGTGFVPGGEEGIGGATIAVCGREGVGEMVSPRGPGLGLRKRRFSARVGEGFADFREAVKKRAGSWSWRRDSVMVPRQGRALRGRVDESSSTIVSPGSGERSRDGGDELSGEDEMISRGHQARPWVRGGRRKSAPARRVSEGNSMPVRRRQTLPAPPSKLSIRDKNYLKRDEEQQFRDGSPRRRLATLERRLRIAEQEGDFDTAAIEKTYKKPHRRLNSECSQQSQASVKLKTKLAKKQAKSNKTFRRAQESRENESPISKVFNRILRRNSRGKELMVESAPASALGSSGGDAISAASSSVWSEDSIERSRGLSVQAVVHIGRAARMAPVPF
ncbi:hypothetical protein MBLNU13_g00296t1 [Cladosporium sp. NU13]